MDEEVDCEPSKVVEDILYVTDEDVAQIMYVLVKIVEILKFSCSRPDGPIVCDRERETGQSIY